MLSKLRSKINLNHTDQKTGVYEVILLGYCSNEVASTHISRYILATKLINGIVLDCASGSCYGSSILRRKASFVVSADIGNDVLMWGKIVYKADCVRADAEHLPFRKQSFDSIVSIETIEHVKKFKTFSMALNIVLKKTEISLLALQINYITLHFLQNLIIPIIQRNIIWVSLSCF